MKPPRYETILKPATHKAMQKALDYILARLSENSTWRGAILLITSIGITIDPSLHAPIIAAGLGLVGLINVIRKGK
jgi:hypothetical protein